MYDGRYFASQIDAIIAHRQMRLSAEKAVCHLLETNITHLTVDELEQVSQIIIRARLRHEHEQPALVAFSTVEENESTT